MTAIRPRSQVYNVRDYGAIGDGTADDTAAITAAVTAAGNNNVVFVPAGTYKANVTLSGLSGTRLEGVGEASIITPASGVGIQVTACAGIAVEALCVNGGATGLDVSGASLCRFRDLRFNAPTIGVHIDGDQPTETTFGQITIRQPVTRGFQYTRTTTADTGGIYMSDILVARGGGSSTTAIGMELTSTVSGAQAFIWGTRVIFDGFQGVSAGVISNIDQVRITQGWWVTNVTGKPALRVNNAHNVVLDSCYFVNNSSTGWGVEFDGATQYLWLTKPIFLPSTSGDGIHYTGNSNSDIYVRDALGLTTSFTNNRTSLTHYNTPAISGPLHVMTRDAGTINDMFTLYTDQGGYRKGLRVNAAKALQVVNNAGDTTILEVSDTGRLKIANGAEVITGAGTPQGSITAVVGSVYLRNDGGADTTLYVKESGTGNTGWVGSHKANFFNVKDAAYGATGDGATDDSTAVQAAITAAQSAGGGVVFFPIGVYKCNTGLTVTAPSVSFLGAGWDQTTTTVGSIIKAGGTITDLINVSSLGERFAMTDMSLDGNGTATNLVTVDALNCQFTRCYGRRPATNGTGWNVTSNGTSVWLTDCRFNGANQAGCVGYAINGTDSMLHGCKAVNCVDSVTYGSTASGGQQIGCHHTPGSTIGRCAINVAGNAANLMLIGNRIDSHNLGSGIQVTPSANIVGLQIVANTFYPGTALTDNTFAAIGLDTSAAHIYQCVINANTIRSSSVNRYSALLTAQTLAGSAATNPTRISGDGMTVNGNSVYAAALFGTNSTPLIAWNNTFSTDGTTWTDAAPIAPLASPAFTGTPSLPTGTTGVTQTAADSSTKLATTAFATTANNLKVDLSKTQTGAAAANAFAYDPVTFNSVVDPIWKIGYNPDGVVAAEPQWFMGLEGNYKVLNNTEGYTDADHNTMEWYIEYDSPDGSTVRNFRPIFANALRDNNSSHSSKVFIDVGNGGFPKSQFTVQATSGTAIVTMSGAGVFVQSGMSLQVAGANVKTVPTSASTLYAPRGGSPFTTTRTANTLYFAGVQISEACTITGISVYNGGTAAGNLIVALYNSTGATQVGVSNSTAQTGTFGVQFVPFTATHAVTPGFYYIAIIPSSSSATFSNVTMFGSSNSAAQGGFTMPGTITAPAVNSSVQMPEVSTY